MNHARFAPDGHRRASEPAHPHPPEPESREETIERIASEEAGAEAQGQPGKRDPTARRKVGIRGLATGHLAGLLVAVPVFVVIYIVSDSLGLALALSGALLIGVGAVIGLVPALREDGRINRDIQRMKRRGDAR